MLMIDSLKLPDTLPDENAMKSWKQSIHDYEPEFWEFQYEIKRYLKNVSNEKLIDRYINLSINFNVLTGKERHIIPINSFLSSWYWYRKEHQTRYEFHQRGLQLPTQRPTPRPAINRPFKSKRPNKCDILCRYGHLEYMKKFVNDGLIRISPASKYNDGPATDPRTDDEMHKHLWELGDNIRAHPKKDFNKMRMHPI